MKNSYSKLIISSAAIVLWSSQVNAVILPCQSADKTCDQSARISDPVKTNQSEPTLVRESHYEISIIPGSYEWVDGIVDGYALEYIALPTVWKTDKRRFVKEHAQPLARLHPFETKDGRTRVQVSKPQIKETRIAAELIQ